MPKDADLHVSVFGPDRVLVYAQTYKAYEAVKACGDRRLMSVDDLVVLIEVLARPWIATTTANHVNPPDAAERETTALIERLRNTR